MRLSFFKSKHSESAFYICRDPIGSGGQEAGNNGAEPSTKRGFSSGRFSELFKAHVRDHVQSLGGKVGLESSDLC